MKISQIVYKPVNTEGTVGMATAGLAIANETGIVGRWLDWW